MSTSHVIAMSYLGRSCRNRLAISLIVLAVPVASAQTNVTLTGHVFPRALAATRLQRVAADEPVRLSLAVRLDDALLNETLEQLYGSSASGSKRFLTSAEFAQKFDLPAKRELLKQFAQAHGMIVDPAEDRSDSMMIKVSANARTVERAFGIELNWYRDVSGQLFRAHESDPVVPASIRPHLNAILGLSDIQGVFQPSLEATPVAPAFQSLMLEGSGPGGGLAPGDVMTIYQLPAIANAGAGQSAAVFELAPFNPTDLAVYSSQFNLPATPLKVISVDGFSSICGPGTCGGLNGTAEVDIDTQLIAGVAPNLSQLLVYDGPNTQQGALDVYNQIATDDSAQVLSISWGESEINAGSAMLQAEAQIFQRMAVQGQTVFSASGDRGAYTAASGALDPAAQPYVTAVGGTSLAGSVHNPVETAWSGSGGGVSGFWPIPDYQTGLAGAASQQFRNVPDVALDADPTSPFAIYVNGSWMSWGGTSCAAPLWAGLTAIVNQLRAAAELPVLGFANPTLYQLAASNPPSGVYRDITSGNNGGYVAGPRYDNVTGWGSYLGAGVLDALTPVTSVENIYSPVAGQLLVGQVTVSGSAFGPNFASYRLDYGAGANPTAFNLIGSVHVLPVTFGTLETWNTAGLATGAYTLRLTVTDTSNRATSVMTFPVSVDNTPPTVPQVSLSATGYTSLELSWTTSTGVVAVAGYQVDLSTSPQFSSYVTGYQNLVVQNVTYLTINSLVPSTTYYARVRAFDIVGNVSANSSVAMATTPTPVEPPPIPGVAVYDPVLMAPACHLVGSTCDSAGLLNGRANIVGGAEPNQSNTILNSCADGPSGIYHRDESNDHLTITTVDGQPFAPGKSVRVTATVWAAVAKYDWLDLWYAPNANSPVWTLIGTLSAPGTGAQIMSMTYTLPTGALQAVRATFRFSGHANVCTTGSYDDHDDLAFAVGSLTAPPLAPVISSPASATATAGSPFSYAITATNSPTSFNATNLPSGLNVSTSTGVISGTPQSAGASTITLDATNAGGTGTATLLLTINPSATPPPVITSPLSASGNVGSNFSYNITATNNPTSYNATGLPSGLSINTASGLISGQPTTKGVFPVTLTASNAAGMGAASLTLTISPAAPPSVPVASFSVTPASGAAPLTVTCDASASTGGNLSYGWNFGDHSSAYGAVVTHTYTTPGVYPIALTLSNIAGSAVVRKYVTVTGN